MRSVIRDKFQSRIVQERQSNRILKKELLDSNAFCLKNGRSTNTVSALCSIRLTACRMYELLSFARRRREAKVGKR
jgi:hypothetical protein